MNQCGIDGQVRKLLDKDEVRTSLRIDCPICGHGYDMVITRDACIDDIDKLYHGYLDKNKIKEAFESLCISFQEEATTKWNGESERRICANAHNQVVEKMNELGIDDDI